MNDQFMDEYSTMFKVIEKTPLFSALSKEEIKEMLSLMTLKKYKKGEIIFSQDSSPNNIFIIKMVLLSFSTEKMKLILTLELLLLEIALEKLPLLVYFHILELQLL